MGTSKASQVTQALGEAGALIGGEASRQLRRLYERSLRRGLYQRPLDFARDRAVLLFFEDVERDTFVRNDRYVRRGLRRVYRALRSGQKVSGFGVAFVALEEALRRAGYTVVVNDFALARANPHYPVGIAGYPHILDGWKLPNPAVLGPGLLDHPSLAPTLMQDPRFRSYIVPCDWMRSLFERVYRDRCVIWYAGMDSEAWPDTSAAQKDLDVLVYEKILWDRPSTEPALLHPVLEALKARGLRYEVLRYRHYNHAQYRALLARSRSMVFLCEHETQGLAYQEAMSSNVPVLAWDQGFWLDPQRPRFDPNPVPASSVPFFSDECGMRFADAQAFGPTLDAFLRQLASFRPRKYVLRELSYATSARRYIEAYAAAGGLSVPGEDAAPAAPQPQPRRSPAA